MARTTAVTRFAPEFVDEAHVAAAAFLARCSGRTLDAYRPDLRYFFQWASDAGLDILGRHTSAHRDLPVLARGAWSASVTSPTEGRRSSGGLTRVLPADGRTGR